MAEALMQMYQTLGEDEQKELYDFALFLISRSEEQKRTPGRKSCFGALKNKLSYIAPDFDAPLEDFAEYM
ncbi:MAG: DUF2281 domain-containing protein [Treponema sp.]|nr:DUF2281 domain-containing protein [Treponema sp.]MBQ6567696.1 DUF2281 domain-containing protein [Treponema sp.]MBQ9616164.1 DUF2281 domain-containing protein [Selenomonadaceae bacterium]